MGVGGAWGSKLLSEEKRMLFAFFHCVDICSDGVNAVGKTIGHHPGQERAPNRTSSPWILPYHPLPGERGEKAGFTDYTDKAVKRTYFLKHSVWQEMGGTHKVPQLCTEGRGVSWGYHLSHRLTERLSSYSHHFLLGGITDRLTLAAWIWLLGVPISKINWRDVSVEGKQLAIFVAKDKRPKRWGPTLRRLHFGMRSNGFTKDILHSALLLTRHFPSLRVTWATRPQFPGPIQIPFHCC